MPRIHAKSQPAAIAVLLLVPLLATCGDGDGVTEPPPETQITAVEVSPAADTLLALGATAQLSATALDANGNAISGVTFTWASSDETIATVDASGVVTAVGNGTAQISATVNTVSGSAELAVAQQVEAVSVTPGTATLTTVGATQQFTAEATDANGNVVQGITFLWQSSDQRVATVDTAGIATAKGSGEATITAAARGVPGNAVLTVDQAIAQLAFITEPADAVAGEALDPAVRVEV